MAGILLVSIFIVQSIPASAGAGAASAAGVVVFVLFCAAGAVGAAAGFLFGLPRSRVVDMTTGGPSGAASNPPPSTSYLTNSNLIKVSDWLTTIIIGLGLVNLRKVPAAIEKLGAALKAPLGGMPYSATIGVSVFIGGAWPRSCWHIYGPASGFANFSRTASASRREALFQSWWGQRWMRQDGF